MRRDLEEHRWRRRPLDKTDAQVRKRGEQTGLDTLVSPRRKRCRFGVVVGDVGSGANALNRPPGEYGRKVKTQNELTGPAQAVEHGLIRCNAKNLTYP